FTDEYVPAAGAAPLQNPNQVTLVEKVRQWGNEARVRVMSYRYRRGVTLQPEIVPDAAFKKYDWSLNSDGSLRSLTQKFELHSGRDRVQVLATFDARNGITTIRHLGPNNTRRIDAPGLILLRMTTARGGLEITYDVNAPVRST